MARKKENLELALNQIKLKDGTRKFLMRNDNVTYELRKFDLSEITQKFLFGMMYKISQKLVTYKKVEIDEDTVTLIFFLKISELKELVNIDYNIEFHQDKMDRIFKELTSTPMTIRTYAEDGKQKLIIWTNLIQQISFDTSQDYLKVFVEERAIPLYKAVAGKFSIWGFEYIAFTEKKYTPRLFELLVSFAKSIGDRNYVGKISKIYELDELKYELKIPQSYLYLHIKNRVLEPCKNELLALDIEEDANKFKLFKSFDYEPIELNINKKGRKAIGSIRFDFELTELTISRLKGEKLNENQTTLKAEVEEKIVEVPLQEAMNSISYWLSTSKNPYLCNLTDDFIDRVYQVIEDIKAEAKISIISDKTLISAFKYFSENLKTIDEDKALNFIRICIKNNLKWHDKIEVE